jgi:membrane protein YdbS with pleckstrin-like domain
MDDRMLPNEKSLLDIRRSPLALLRGLFDLTVALLLLWGMLKAMADVPFWDSWWLVEQYRELATRFLWEGAGIPAGWIAAVFGLLAFLVGLGALRQLIREASRRYSVTSLRILSRRGFLGRATDELYLLSVDGVSLHQSPLGRLLGHADLIIAGRGNNQLKFTFVRSPDEVREKVDRIVLARRTKQPQD